MVDAALFNSFFLVALDIVSFNALRFLTALCIVVAALFNSFFLVALAIVSFVALRFLIALCIRVADDCCNA